MQSLYKTPAGKQEIMALYDAALARWPVAYQTVTLPTRHGDTFVIASGAKSAPPLILLHGASSNAVSWVGDVAAYSACMHVYAVDIPGSPGKSAENRPAWDGPGYAEWLEDVLDGLNIQDTTLLGISQGGRTALKFATTHPKRVNKLVLLAPGGVMPTRPSFIYRALFYTLLGRWGAQRINRMVFGKDRIHPEAVKFMDAIMTNFKAEVVKEYLHTDAELRRLDMPVMVLGGTEDVICPMQDIIARLRKFVPRLEAVLLPGSGHVVVNMSEKVLPFLGRT